METIAAFFKHYPELAIFLTLALGFLIGKLKIGGFSFGTVVGTLLAGVLVGQLGIQVPGIVKTVFFDLGATLVEPTFAQSGEFSGFQILPGAAEGLAAQRGEDQVGGRAGGKGSLGAAGIPVQDADAVVDAGQVGADGRVIGPCSDRAISENNSIRWPVGTMKLSRRPRPGCSPAAISSTFVPLSSIRRAKVSRSDSLATLNPA